MKDTNVGFGNFIEEDWKSDEWMEGYSAILGSSGTPPISEPIFLEPLTYSCSLEDPERVKEWQDRYAIWKAQGWED